MEALGRRSEGGRLEQTVVLQLQTNKQGCAGKAQEMDSLRDSQPDAQQI